LKKKTTGKTQKKKEGKQKKYGKKKTILKNKQQVKKYIYTKSYTTYPIFFKLLFNNGLSRHASMDS
jgi:hypothetical protein